MLRNADKRFGEFLSYTVDRGTSICAAAGWQQDFDEIRHRTLLVLAELWRPRRSVGLELVQGCMLSEQPLELTLLHLIDAEFPAMLGDIVLIWTGDANLAVVL
jgi:hypothetical protein